MSPEDKQQKKEYMKKKSNNALKSQIQKNNELKSV